MARQELNVSGWMETAWAPRSGRCPPGFPQGSQGRHHQALRNWGHHRGLHPLLAFGLGRWGPHPHAPRIVAAVTASSRGSSGGRRGPRPVRGLDGNEGLVQGGNGRWSDGGGGETCGGGGSRKKRGGGTVSRGFRGHPQGPGWSALEARGRAGRPLSQNGAARLLARAFPVTRILQGRSTGQVHRGPSRFSAGEAYPASGPEATAYLAARGRGRSYHTLNGNEEAGSRGRTLRPAPRASWAALESAGPRGARGGPGQLRAGGDCPPGRTLGRA